MVIGAQAASNLSGKSAIRFCVCVCVCERACVSVSVRKCVAVVRSVFLSVSFSLSQSLILSHTLSCLFYESTQMVLILIRNSALFSQ